MGGMNCGLDFGNLDGMNRHLGYDYRLVNVGLR
jgi:hypothetical protein